MRRTDAHWTCMFTGQIEVIRTKFSTAVPGTPFIANSVSIYIYNATETLYLLPCAVLFPMVAIEYNFCI